MTVTVRILMVWLCLGLAGGSWAQDRPGLSSVALRAADPATGPLFTKLRPSVTGIDFVSTLKRPNQIPFINTGAGVAIGDVDADGLADIYLLSTDTPNKLYRQTSPWRFEDITAKAGVDGGAAWSRGASFVDIDGDGDLDLYVCNTEAPNLLYINQGDGSFVERGKAFGLDHVAASIMAYFADYDRDGDLDLYLLTYRALHQSLPEVQIEELVVPADTVKTLDEMRVRPVRTIEKDGRVVAENPEDWADFGRGGWELAGQRDRLFRNNGDGTFSDVTEAAGLTDYGLGLSAAWMDFDRDGWLDIYVGNDLTTRDRIFRNNGDGTFTNIVEYLLPHTTWTSMGSDFGDVNNDGRLDFYVADMAGSSHYKSKRNMGDMSTFSDFLSNEWPRQKMQNALFLATGLARYIEVSAMAGLDATDWTWSVRFGDLDNDGRLDLFTTNGTSRDDMSLDLIGIKMFEVWDAEGEAAAMEYMKTIPQAPSPDFAFRNLGGLEFEDVSAAWGLNHDGISFGAAYADLDRDGDLDLVVNRLGEPAGIYRNQSAGGGRVLVRLQGQTNRYGLGALVRLTSASGTQVRHLMPTRGFMSSEEPLVHFGLGEDTAFDLAVEWPEGHTQQVAGLVAGRFYTVEEQPGAATIKRLPNPRELLFRRVAKPLGLEWRHQERNFDDYSLQELLPLKLSQLGPGLAWGDADGDGLDDLFVGGAAGQPGEVFLYRGRAGFERRPGPWSAHAESEDMAALWLDADGDGDQDLFVSSGSNEYPVGDLRQADRLYRNDGTGVFSHDAEALPADHGFSGASAAADFDGDGDLDLFVGGRAVPGRYPTAPRSRLLRNDGGRFSDVTAAVAPGLGDIGMVTGALFSDATGDGRPDLLLTLEWGPVCLFANLGGSFADHSQPAGLAERTGWWNSITGGDFNGDGAIDYAVANLGLNSKYSASPELPTRIYYGDVDGSGEPHLIEASSTDEGLLPVRGRSCSSLAMPFVKERFPTYHDYASARLTDIYPDESLAGAQAFEAVELASGILLNDGAGRFDWRPLPRLVQASPGYGMVASDYNGDGHTDLYIVQNFFSREPETGLLDGGVSILLFGDGNGDFRVLDPAESGLMVPGDGKGLAGGDLNRDGWPDVVLTQNNGPLAAFGNHGVAGHGSLAVRLQGLAGNPAAVGARVTLERSDGHTQT
ncbi:MAG: VCBS repeat-containing protein, partial [Acidobacteriota bacterium]